SNVVPPERRSSRATRRFVDDMNEKQDRPYVCGAPGCSQRFQSEEHLILHSRKHEMTLKFPAIKADTAFTDRLRGDMELLMLHYEHCTPS
ncbi:unnamed protein product, partial [Pleuronectes platessa]